MKKFLLLVAAGLMLISTGANAQFKSSKLWIGGSFGFSNTSVTPNGGTSSSGSSFRLVPEIGYRQSKDWGFGIGIGYLSGYGAIGSIDPNNLKGSASFVGASFTDNNNNGGGTSGFFVAPFVRRYWSFGKNVAIFVEGGVNFVTGSTEQDDDDDPTTPRTEQKSTAFEVGIRPGFQYTAGKRVTLFAKFGNLGFQHISVQDVMSINRFGLDFDAANFVLGLTWGLK